MNQHFHCMYFLKQLMDGFFFIPTELQELEYSKEIFLEQCIPTYCYSSGQFLSCKSGL